MVIALLLLIVVILIGPENCFYMIANACALILAVAQLVLVVAIPAAIVGWLGWLAFTAVRAAA